jgi:hypothetical protein
VANLRSCVLIVNELLVAACGTGARRGAVDQDLHPTAGQASAPQLLKANAFRPSYPPPLRNVGVQGTVVERLGVMSDGRVDPGAEVVVSAMHPAFADSLRRFLPALRFRPARANGLDVAGFIVMNFSYRIDIDCYRDDAPSRIVWKLDSVPPGVEIHVCQASAPTGHFDPTRVRSRRVTLSGLLSEGFEDGFFTPCRSEKIPIKSPPGTRRIMTIDWRGMIGDARLPTPDSDHLRQQRYFVRMTGVLTGPQQSGHMGLGAYVFKPSRVLEAAWWSDKSCQF